ncbi:drug/metabolite transporter (DMT)-like permease [Pedobacter sp. CAN_A7]|uniref:EamA family transporter n=1 Tax=Pedobacter sp. CAN_A7 TaxID=2787722 RepID=UPI0018C9A61C
MIYILISICCSITVAVLLKLARRYKIDVVQAVTWNYLVAIFLAVVFFKPQVNDLLQRPAPVYMALGILLPVIFWFLAASIKNIGIVKTDIAQRLSLFLPILAAYFIFNEQLSTFKIIGLAVGMLAILLTLLKRNQQSGASSNWVYPLVVFFGFGIIDILFKQVALLKIIPYTTSLIVVFSIAFLISLVYMLTLAYQKKHKIALINVICGVFLGVFNFGNILFYLKAHQAFASSPSTVFAAMNMGVIILGSIIGVVLFKEKLSKVNYLGLCLALMAIVLITLSQIYVI